MTTYSNLILADDPSLYWRLGADDLSIDLSGSGHSGTPIGGFTYGTIPVNPTLGYATDFDGVDDQITSGYAAFSNSTAQTFELWVNFDTLPAGGTVPFLGSSYNVALQIPSTGAAYWYPDVPSGATSVAPNGTVTTGIWYHVALAFDSPNNLVYFYIDGTLVQQAAITTNYAASPGNFFLNGYGGQFLNGKITNVAIYERALTASELATHNEVGRWQGATGASVRTRERPSLRLSIDVATPGGNHYRWAEDEPGPSTTPTGLSFSSAMPGGFEAMSCVLPRKPSIAYGDLDRLSTITIRDASTAIVGQYRLEAVPRTSGDQMAVAPQAVGWQATLEDNKSAAAIYIDRDLGRWTDMIRDRREALLLAAVAIGDAGTEPAAGKPSLKMSVDGEWSSSAAAEAWYDAGTMGVGGVLWNRSSDSSTILQPSTSFVFQAHSSTDGLTFAQSSADSHTAIEDTDAAASLLPSANRRYLAFQWSFVGANTNAEQYWSSVYDVVVLGRHGLTLQGTYPDVGYFASDMIQHAVTTWASALACDSTTITGSDLVIPHAVFPDATTVADIISTVNRFELFDWAVWERAGVPTFYYHPRGSRGKSWRARVAPSGLAEHGPDVQRLWNGVIVKYQDVDGSTRTVGPIGSGANVESAVVEDPDPLNPTTQRGIKRWDLLDMGGVSTVLKAAYLGRRFLQEAKRLDTSGQARLVGHVEDDRGVLWPASHIRAGDTISFVDASDTSPRRIVKANYDHDGRSMSIDLDAPPDALAALLERLQVVLVPLGI